MKPWEEDHEGHYGARTADLLAGLPSYLNLNLPDIILVMAGTNDITALSSELREYPDTSKQCLSAIIDTLRGRNPNIIVLLAQITPVLDDTPATIALNEKIAELAVEKNTVRSPVILVDQYTGFTADDYGMDKAHPDDETGNPKIAAKWFAGLRPMLDTIRNGSVAVTLPLQGFSAQRGDVVSCGATAHAQTGVKEVLFSVNASAADSAIKQDDSTFVCNQLHAYPAGVDTIKAIAIDNLDLPHPSSSGVIVNVTRPLPAPSTIMTVQDTGFKSPFSWKTVGFRGIITAITADSAAFWVQDTARDLRCLVPDAIKVDAHNINKALLRSGDFVYLTGMVADEQGARSLPYTCLIADSVASLSSHNSLPQPIAVYWLSTAADSIDTMRAIYHRYEGMLVSFPCAQIVTPVDKSGVWGLVPANVAAPWVSPWQMPTVQPAGGAQVNYLPPIISVGSATLKAAPVVRPGDRVLKLAGVLDYDTSKAMYLIQPSPDSLSLQSAATLPPSPVSVRTSNQPSFRLTTMNFGCFFDSTVVPGGPVVSGADYLVRVQKTVRAVISELMLPGVISVQGVENETILDSIAASVNFQTGRGYKGISYQTSDPLGLRPGFLYDTTSVKCDSTWQISSGIAGERQSLCGVFQVNTAYFAIVNVDFMDRRQDDPLFGYDWPLQWPAGMIRKTQAAAVRASVDSLLVQYPWLPLFIMGQVNDNAFVEPGQSGSNALTILKGDAGIGEAVFYNAYDYLGSAMNKFTQVRDGRAFMPAHLLVNGAAAAFASGVDILHFNAGWPAGYAADASTAVRACDDDPIEIRF